MRYQSTENPAQTAQHYPIQAVWIALGCTTVSEEGLGRNGTKLPPVPQRILTNQILVLLKEDILPSGCVDRNCVVNHDGFVVAVQEFISN